MTTLASISRVVPRPWRVEPPRAPGTRQQMRASRKTRAPRVTTASSNDDDSSWWNISRLLPPKAKEAVREIEYFGGSPLQQVLPWAGKPKTDSPGRPYPLDPANQRVLFDFTSTSPEYVLRLSPNPNKTVA
jgi:hypothetical protein